MIARLLLVAALAQAAAVWPQVRPLTRSFPVDLRARVVSLDLPILSEDGSQAYLFWCEGGTDFAGLNALAERHRFNSVAPLMCVLNEGTQRDEGSLLAEGDEAPWFTRAMFRPEQLVGACGAYPEFGAHRTFRLRGLLLTLTAARLQSDRNGLRSFTLTVNAYVDATAGTSHAEPSGYLAPRASDCADVQVDSSRSRDVHSTSRDGNLRVSPDRLREAFQIRFSAD
jgi:hypothetical protein